MRSVAIGVALLAGVALPAVMAEMAWAQIAAPSLMPGSFSSENPAAIKWGAPSRFGGGYVGQRDVSDPGNVKTDFAGAFGGFRLVGETLALGVEGVHLEDQEDNLHDERDFTSAALALQTGVIAWGLGYNAFKQTLDSAKAETQEPNFGISLRLGEIWFIGGTVGREAATYKDALLPAADFHGERDVLRGGIGFRRGGTVLVHIEAFAIDKKDYETNKSGKFGSESTSGGTLEFTFWNLLIGGSARRTKVSKTSTDTIEIATGDLGWAPREGLSLTLHYEATKIEYKQQPTDPEPPTRKSELGAVILAYSF